MQDTKELRSTLNHLEALDEELRRRKRQHGIDYYIPNAVQLKAHKSCAPNILFVGGNRTGKSTLGAVELTWHLTRKYPDFIPVERRFFRPIKAVVVCDANQKIEKVIEPKITEYLPHNYIAHIKRVPGGYLNRIECIDGSTVDFLSGEQDQMAFEGHDWDFLWGDEPQKKRRYDALRRGLVDRQGKMLLTFTPIAEPWMKETIVDKADGKHIDVITAMMRDNLADIKGHSILTEEAIQEFESGLDPDMRETRVYGRFFHMRGIVYKEFSDIHLVTASDTFKYVYPDPVICVLDPHDRQPHHVIWAYITRADDIFVHTELTLACTVDELARAIKRHEAQEKYKIRRRIIDPNFGRKPLITTGRNMIEEFAHCGLPGWGEADDPREEGRLKVKEYLHYDTSKPVSHTNCPKLYFFRDNVPLTIHSVRNHQYDEWVGSTKEERDPKEKEKDKETHGADVVRYLCMTNPTYRLFQDAEYELEEVPY